CRETIRVIPDLSTVKTREILAQLDQQNVVFTSAHAVTGVHQHLITAGMENFPAWKFFVLAGKTKEAVLSKAGSVAVTEARSASELAEKIIQSGVREVVFFCGSQRRDELPELLKAHGVRVHEVVVYETEETPGAIAGRFDGMLFFSPSAVKSYFAANQPDPAAACFAIGETTATSLRKFVPGKIIVCDFPSQRSMIDSVISYFKNIKHQYE
ncbi:MAG TPA: uroporphyrinogen-III synthase, partial [Flavisolibacter sp.]